MKLGLNHFPPYELLVLRFAVVAAVLLPFYLKRTIPMKFLLGMSFVLGTVHFVLVFGGMAYGLDISTSVITVQLGVPFSCLLSAILFDDRLGGWRSFGMVIAFLGVMFIAGTPNVVDHFIPFVMVMAGAFCWAVANVMMKRQGAINVLEMLAWMSLLAVPQLALISLLFESNQIALLMSPTAEAVGSVLFSAIGSTVIAYGLWYYLLRQCDVSQVAPFNLMVPLFGIALGQMFVDEPLTWRVIIGGLITISGVAIIVIRKPRLATLPKTPFRKKQKT